MMSRVFSIVLQMNLTAVLTAAVLLPVKGLMRRLGCPKGITFWLWGMIALRLMCPVLPQTELSIFSAAAHLPNGGAILRSAQLPAAVGRQGGQNTAQADSAAAKNSGGAQLSDAVPSAADSAESGLAHVLGIIWLCGTACMLCGGAAAYLRLRYRLRFAVRREANIWQAEGLTTSFVFGLWHPKIYIPLHIPAEQLDLMLLHERMHVKRKDYITKLLAYVLLSLHWCNPVCWLLYKLFADDVELCCDEAVLAMLDQTRQTAYAEALFCGALQAAEGCASPGWLGFASGIVKRRIQNVMRYQSKSTLCHGVTLLLCLVSILPFATNAAAAPLPIAAPTRHDTFPVQTPPLSRAADKSTETDTEDETAAPKVTPEPTSSPAATPSPGAVRPTEAPTETTGATEEVTPIDAAQTALAEPSHRRIGQFSTLDDGISRERQMICGADGTLLLQLQMNTSCLMRVTVCDAADGRELLSDMVLADSAAAYTLSDLTPGKAYDVLLQSATGTDWAIEGSYSIE